MATPTDLQNASAAIQWTNGRGLVTGAQVAGIFAVVISILAGMGTWNSAGFTPNIAAGSIGSAQLAPGAAAGNLGAASGDVSGALPGPLTVNQIFGQAPSAILLPHVNTNALLQARTDYTQPVVRDGFYAAGDGGGETYVHFSAPCSQNAGAGDNGWQVEDQAKTGCWIADLSKPVSVRVWGAHLDSTGTAPIDGVTVHDDLPAWQAAVAAMGAGGGTSTGPAITYGKTSGTILFSATNGKCSALSATLQINLSGVSIRGDNPHASCFDPQFATGNGVQVGDAADYPFDVNIEHVGFRSDVVHRTAGASLELFGDYNVNVSDITCYDYYYTCLGVDQGQYGVNYFLDRIKTEGTLGVFGVSIGAQGNVAGGPIGIYAPVGVRLTRSELDGNGHNQSVGAGLNLVNVSGFDLEQLNEDYNRYGVWIHPGAGQYVSGWYGTDNAFDASDVFGMFVDTTGGGKFTNSKLVTEWIASCGSTSAPATCVLWQGPASSVENITIDWQVISAFAHGVTINTGNDIHLSGTIAGNGLASGGTFHGLVVGASATGSVSDLTWDGRIGGSVGADAVDPTNIQACAIYISYGAPVSNIIAKGDFSGNQHNPAVCDNSGVASNDYSGVFPGQPWQSFTPAVTCSGNGPTGQGSGKFYVRGKTVSFEETLPVPSGTCSGLSFAPPTTVNTQTNFAGHTVDGKAVLGAAAAGATSVPLTNYDGSATGASGQTYTVGGVYDSP